MEKGPENNDSIKNLIVDANNQVSQFQFFSAEEAKIRLSEYDFKTLEMYTEKTYEEIEREFPGMCNRYNSLIEEFKNGEFDEVRFREIIQEVGDLTHGR
jgi:hypothetical protein